MILTCAIILFLALGFAVSIKQYTERRVARAWVDCLKRMVDASREAEASWRTYTLAMERVSLQLRDAKALVKIVNLS